jgi:hypothetical protein
MNKSESYFRSLDQGALTSERAEPRYQPRMDCDDQPKEWCPTCENRTLEPEDCGECHECLAADGVANPEIWALAVYYFNVCLNR